MARSSQKNKISKEAYKCYNRCRGYCSANYKTANEVCLYCLEFILRRPNPNKKETDIEPQRKEIEIPKYKLKKSKFPIDLIDFPIKKTKDFIKTVDEEGKDTLELYLKGRYGKYHIVTPRQYKLMDIRTLLATLYFSDYYKDHIFTEKFTNWLDLMELKSTGFYRKSIIEGLEYLSDTKFYTPYLYDTENKIRDHFSLKENGEIDWNNLPSYSKWHILSDYSVIKKRKKYSIEVILGDTFYKRLSLSKYYTLIDFKKVLPLKDITLNLYLFIKRQDPKSISNYKIDFELLKAHVGITTKNVTWARKTFEKAWKDIKERDLLKGYRHRIFTSKKDNKKYIIFKKLESLMSVNK